MDVGTEVVQKLVCTNIIELNIIVVRIENIFLFWIVHLSNKAKGCINRFDVTQCTCVQRDLGHLQNVKCHTHADEAAS